MIYLRVGECVCMCVCFVGSQGNLTRLLLNYLLLAQDLSPSNVLGTWKLTYILSY